MRSFLNNQALSISLSFCLHNGSRRTTAPASDKWEEWWGVLARKSWQLLCRELRWMTWNSRLLIGCFETRKVLWLVDIRDERKWVRGAHPGGGFRANFSRRLWWHGTYSTYSKQKLLYRVLYRESFADHVEKYYTEDWEKLRLGEDLDVPFCI